MERSRETSLQIRAAGIAILGLFILLVAASYFSGRQVERSSDLISRDAVPGTITAHYMRMAMSRGIGWAMVAASAQTLQSRDQSLETVHEADAAFDQAVKEYESTILINPTQDRALLEQVKTLYAEYLRQQKAYEALILAGDRNKSADFLERDLVPAYLPAIQAAEKLVTYNHVNGVLYAENIHASVYRLYLTVALVTVLAAICAAVLLVNFSIRRQEVAELRASERRLQEVLDNLHISVFVLDPGFRVLEVNRGPLERAGLKREEVLGVSLPETYWWSYSEPAKEQLRNALNQAAAGAFVRYDVEFRKGDGKLGTEDFACGPIRDAEGRVTQIVVAAIDISVRKDLEQQFLRAQRMEAIGKLAGGVVHDLNNILAPIIMAGGLLRMKLTDPEDHRIIELIEGSAQRGAGIIKQLLTFGRGTEDARGLVQVRHLLRDMAHIIQETFPRNIQLKQDLAAKLWPVVADATQIHQVLLNLSVNARDAMPAGGTFTLSARNVEITGADIATIPQARMGRHLLITATDTGEGIPPAIITRIFDPFFTTKPVGKGTGLGLSTVQSIVKDHGGFMTVESEPGKGATFKVYLPAAESLETEAPIAAKDRLPRGHGETVLLVDDEAAMQTITREVLEMHGYRVIVAGNGERAVRRYLEERAAIKVVVTDVEMPLMDGPELIRALRVLDEGLKFVVLSGSQLDDKLVLLKTLGIDEVLKKPCDPERLLTALQKACTTA